MSCLDKSGLGKGRIRVLTVASRHVAGLTFVSRFTSGYTISHFRAIYSIVEHFSVWAVFGCS